MSVGVTLGRNCGGEIAMGGDRPVSAVDCNHRDTGRRSVEGFNVIHLSSFVVVRPCILSVVIRPLSVLFMRKTFVVKTSTMSQLNYHLFLFQCLLMAAPFSALSTSQFSFLITESPCFCCAFNSVDGFRPFVLINGWVWSEMQNHN